MKKFTEFIKDIIVLDKYQKILFSKELTEKYKNLQNLKPEEQDAAINALSDELKVNLIEYGTEVMAHYRDYFFPFYEYEDDYRWYEKGMYKYNGDQSKFENTLKKLEGLVVKEDVEEKEIKYYTNIPKTGKISWNFLLLPNYNNFIYHILRQFNGQNKWRSIEALLEEKRKASLSLLQSLAGKNTTVTLAIPAIIGDKKPIAIYPSVIIDSIDGDNVTFHIDPKKYRTIKDSYGYNIKTTGLNLEYIKLNPDDLGVKKEEKTNITDGIELMNGGKRYWYKVYGKEKGQLHYFIVNKDMVMLYSDLVEVYDTAIKQYIEAREEKKKYEADEKARKTALLKRGKELFDNMDQIKELWSQVKKNKYDDRDKFLDTLTIEQLKDIESLAYYRWAYHYDIYALKYKIAEMADDYRAYSSLSSALLSIRDRDGDISVRAKEAIERKAKQNE